MVTGREDLLQALIEAFLMEKGTREFYLYAAKKATGQAAREMFSELSCWEDGHMGYIQHLYQALQDDREMQTFADFREKSDAPDTEAGIPVKDLEKAVEEYSFEDDKEALVVALGIEGKAYNLYRALSETAADSNARVVFREMMEQEKKHIDAIREMRERIS
ncbi:MAG: ferritin family protein [Nitrospirales bacterium]|nr:ferritin family protein [Nitrospirales bacterium]